MANTSSLASLTAQYTDSEGEEEHDQNSGGAVAGTVYLTEESNLSKPSSPVAPPPRKRKANIKRLVSYHDDTYVSSEDEEEATGSDAEDENEGSFPTNHVLSAEDEEAQMTEEMKTKAELDAKASAALLDGVELPKEPSGKCSAELQDKISRFHEKMVSGRLDMNSMIQQRKDFRNPSIYEKLIQYCKINELGTNYPVEHYDPLRWTKESFYEELAKVQKADMDRREKERKEKAEKAKVEIMTGTVKRTSVGAVTGTAKPSGTSAVSAPAAAQLLPIAAEEAKRKSKWDQVAAQQQPTALTANITGTKSTVISAFGSLPKRPRI